MILEVYYTEYFTNKNGERWFVINGDTAYSLDSGWTEETAIADYTSPEHAIEDAITTARAFGAYD